MKELKRRNRRAGSNAISGYTLVEVAMVIALIGILAAVAIPSFFSFLPNMRLKQSARDLYSDMQRAKVEAVKRNVNVVIVFNAVACPGFPNPTSVPVPGGGYTGFVDDGSGAGGVRGDSIQNGAEMTLFSETMPRNVALCSESFGGRMGFLPSGLPVGNTIGTVTLNSDRSKDKRVSLTISGGVRIQ